MRSHARLRAQYNSASIPPFQPLDAAGSSREGPDHFEGPSLARRHLSPSWLLQLRAAPAAHEAA
eukprot:scaffold3825_cov225-Pinguiococcus_pyrenoidosus.AAC.5